MDEAGPSNMHAAAAITDQASTPPSRNLRKRPLQQRSEQSTPPSAPGKRTPVSKRYLLDGEDGKVGQPVVINSYRNPYGVKHIFASIDAKQR